MLGYPPIIYLSCWHEEKLLGKYIVYFAMSFKSLGYAFSQNFFHKSWFPIQALSSQYFSKRIFFCKKIYLGNYLKCRCWTPIPDLLNQYVWDLDPKIYIFIDSPGNLYAHLKFQNYLYKYFKKLFSTYTTFRCNVPIIYAFLLYKLTEGKLILVYFLFYIFLLYLPVNFINSVL